MTIFIFRLKKMKKKKKKLNKVCVEKNKTLFY